jgi:hypothetical protein
MGRVTAIIVVSVWDEPTQTKDATSSGKLALDLAPASLQVK